MTRQPTPEPLQVNEVRVIAIGTALWAIGLVVLIALSPRLTAAGNGWWVWTAATGVVLGLLGLVIVRRRRHRGP